MVCKLHNSSKTKTCERYSEIVEKHLKVKLGEYGLEKLSPIYWTKRNEPGTIPSSLVNNYILNIV